MSIIKLEQGWNPNFEPGTAVIAIKPCWTIKVGQVFEYKGGCDHPDWGWAIFLKDCDIHIPGYVFETHFRKVD
ncbi:MAG: hypothetical protein PHF21_03320 [Bacilli bacterium]|nr:hypothetical protein [Bacilli bacterium]